MYYIYKDKLSTINLFIIKKKATTMNICVPCLRKEKNGWKTGNRIEMKRNNKQDHLLASKFK